MATTDIRGWTFERLDDTRIRLSKTGRTGTLTIEHQAGMTDDVLAEFATLRTFEADIRDAGGDDAPEQLRAEYQRHKAVSKANQQHREKLRRIQEGV